MKHQKFAGFEPSELLESIAKRLVEGSAGRGGIEAICQFLDQIDWIKDLSQLRLSIKNNTVFFESALSKCTKEMLKRPLPVRKREISEILGATCPKCGYNTSFWNMLEMHRRCPSCDGHLTPTTALAISQLVAQKIEITPETMLMTVAYEKLAQAYVDAYKALGLVLENFAKLFGWDRYRVNQRMLQYMNAYFLGRMAGEQKISREEKECLQFVVRGNLARIPVEEAEKLLRLGISVVKYGYLYEVLGAVGAYTNYQQKVADFDALYSRLNAEVREALGELSQEAVRRIRVKKTLGGYYAPCLIVPKRNWTSGMFSGEIMLEPVYNLPIFPKEDFGAIQAIYGKFGSGKTFLLSSLICYSFFAKHQAALIPLNDKSNSYSLAFMPLFAYNKRTAHLLHILEMLGVEPQGIPCITISVLRKGEKIENIKAHPPTVYDRILEVEDYRNFKVDFDELMSELKAVAEEYGFSQPVGIIAFRNLQREHDKAYFDVQVASNVLNEFDHWRKGNPTRAMRVVLDEVSYMAATKAFRYGSDKLKAGATVVDFIKESRRNNISVDAATQLPLELIQELRDYSTNIFFRDLAMSKDKSRSQIDFLLESMQLRDPALKTIIREMNNRGLLPKGFWFWHHQPTYNIQVIRPCPPTFMLNDRKRTPFEIIRLYEKTTGQKVLLESWSKVKRLKTAKPSFSKHPTIPDF